MKDYERFHAHGPLQPAAPDDWHDRKSWPPVWFSLILIAFAIGLAVLS